MPIIPTITDHEAGDTPLVVSTYNIVSRFLVALGIEPE